MSANDSSIKQTKITKEDVKINLEVVQSAKL